MADITYDSGAENSAAANNVTVTTGSVTDGKILFALCRASSSASASWSAPGGWTNLVQTINPNGNPVALFYTVASSLPTTHNFTCSDSSSSAAAIAIYSNNDTASPLDATTTSGSGTASTITVPSITTSTDRALHLIILYEHNLGAPSLPSGYTSDYQAIGNAARFCSKIITPAGSVSGVTATNGSSWNAVSVAIKPAAGGGGGGGGGLALMGAMVM